MVLGTSGESKFKYNGTEITVPNNVFVKFEPVVIERRLEDEATGKLHVKHIGERYYFQCQSYIGNESQFIDEFNRIYQYRNKQVYCAPFKEGEYFQDSNGNEVLCQLTIQYGYLKTRNFYDLLILTFETLDVVDLSKMALSTETRFDPDGMVRIDPDEEIRISTGEIQDES